MAFVSFCCLGGGLLFAEESRRLENTCEGLGGGLLSAFSAY